MPTIRHTGSLAHQQSKLWEPAFRTERRPFLTRIRSAPAQLGNAETQLYDSIEVTIIHHARKAQDDAEAGCFRLLMRGVKWWAWHRWRNWQADRRGLGCA